MQRHEQSQVLKHWVYQVNLRMWILSGIVLYNELVIVMDDQKIISCKWYTVDS